MEDEQLDKIDRMVRDHAQSYNAPPAADVDRMWHAVEAQHFGVATRAGQAATLDVGEDMLAARRRASRPWYAGSWLRVAAALALGVGLGRVSLPAGDGAPAPTVATAASRGAATTNGGTGSTANTAVMSDPATLRYIGQTVALLASFESDSPPLRGDSAIKARAQELLLSTRLLLDAPDTTDPIVHSLLEDLELVLVQIVQMPPKRNASDVYLIKEAMDQRDVMPRLIAAVTTTTSAE